MFQVLHEQGTHMCVSWCLDLLQESVPLKEQKGLGRFFHKTYVVTTEVPLIFLPSLASFTAWAVSGNVYLQTLWFFKETKSQRIRLWQEKNAFWLMRKTSSFTKRPSHWRNMIGSIPLLASFTTWAGTDLLQVSQKMSLSTMGFIFLVFSMLARNGHFISTLESSQSKKEKWTFHKISILKPKRQNAVEIHHLVTM